MRKETDSEDELRPENPQKGANWISIATFWYTLKIFRVGRHKELNEDDLTKPLNEHKSSMLGEKMARLWAAECERAKRRKNNPSLTYVIFQCFAKTIFGYSVILAVMELFVRINQPIFLGLLLRYFNPDNKRNNITSDSPTYVMRIFYYYTPNQTRIETSEAYVYATGLVLTSLISVLVLHPYMVGVMHVGMQIRIACCSLIYRKALRVSLSAMVEQTAGNAVNLISNDVNRFDMALMFLHYLWIAPTQMFIALYFIYREMGYSAVLGICAVILFIPLQAWFGYRTSYFRLRTALRTDERVRQMNEIIQGMQVIKMYTWEYAFSDLIAKSREQEIVVLKQTSYIRGLIMSFIMFTSRCGIFVTTLSYVLRDKDVTAEKVFMITSYYQILRHTMTLFFPQGIAQVAESSVAISRVKKFLLMEETDIGDPSPLYGTSKTIHIDHETRTKNTNLNAFIKMENVSAKYGKEVCLNNVDLEIKKGELTAIVGQVGSGKTCLLSLILGELVPFEGNLTVNGVISYASQEPWLFAGSVRQNILFGRPYEPYRYQKVVRVCALLRDFTLLPYGDQTIVGERGVSLSGGQRARVNLARAVYKEADIYLLDDPLSAVDTHVGRELFEQCISGYLSDKVVILVTHQLQHLRNTKQIVIMDEGSIEGKGDFHKLQISGLNYASFFTSDLQDTSKPGVFGSDTSIISSGDKKIEAILKRLSVSNAMDTNVVDKEKKMVAPTEVAEMRTIGAIQGAVYGEYFKAGGNCCVIIVVILLFLLAQLLVSGGDYFLCQWVNMEEADHKNLTKAEARLGIFEGLTRRNAIIIYSVIIGATILVAIVRSLAFFTLCMRSSVNLHNRMFDSIIRATMRFFETNTSGRILNRFSKDLGAIDEFLPNAMIDCGQIFLNLLGAIIVVAVVEPYLLIPTCAVCLSFYLIRRYYLFTSRSVKRLDGIARSPVFAHLNATLQGLQTIRSNGAEVILTSEFDKYQDVHSSAWFMFIATSRAFGLWLDLICTLYIGIVTYSFLIFITEPVGSEVGLAITQCIGLSGLFQWGMRQSAELENQMTSVERVLEFTRVDHEPNLHSIPEKKPPPNWPTTGHIKFNNVVMSYVPNTPPVLKNLNIDIFPQQKIGIVGRTGAGKSSLLASLFRLTTFDGSVIIDGLDTKEMGLHDLRRKISIIPQEPVIFSGTLRYNLDPFNQYDDSLMLDALIVVEIKAALQDGIACLDYPMTEGGSNISVGERQMVCLARAILRNNVILVLDEATANVDPQTDRFIQVTIRSKFSGCTVLTIAHRLHTVMDSDKVLVMDAGLAVEFDHPHILLQKKDGFLSKMVNNTGKSMAENLKLISKENYDTKKAQSSKK